MASSKIHPSSTFSAVVTSNTASTYKYRSLLALTAGNLSLEDDQGTVSVVPVAAGQVIPLQASKVLTASTATVLGME